MAVAQPAHQQDWPASYDSQSTTICYGCYSRVRRSPEEAEAPAEVKPVVPLYGLHGLAHLPLIYRPALPLYAPALAHPAVVPALAPAVGPTVNAVVAAPDAPAPNDPTAPAAWAAAHPEGLVHESVSGGLRTNHGDGSSYVFRSNVV